MTTYIVGDVHGSYKTFLKLLAKISFDPEHDQLWLVGDIVNNGQGSLEMIKWLIAHERCAKTVLGNHDLHMLAVASGARPARAKDTFMDVLEAPDADELCDWLKRQPMLIVTDELIITHAGLLPQWELEVAQELAQELEQTLKGSQTKDFFERMYGDEPRAWEQVKDKEGRLRITVNALTRMRILDEQDRLEFKFKGELKDVPQGHKPWFRDLEEKTHQGRLVCFGHWSALGVHRQGQALGLDSGCTWGRALSAYALESGVLYAVEAIG